MMDDQERQTLADSVRHVITELESVAQHAHTLPPSALRRKLIGSSFALSGLAGSIPQPTATAPADKAWGGR